MSNEASRQEFEAWARSFGCSFKTTGYAPYDYCNADVQLLWRSWQASRAALEAEQAQIEDLRTQLARRTVERDLAIQIAACGEQAQTVRVTPLRWSDEREPLSDFEMRGVLAQNLMCWHRLTEAEAQDLVCFFKKVQPPQGDKQ